MLRFVPPSLSLLLLLVLPFLVYSRDGADEVHLCDYSSDLCGLVSYSGLLPVFDRGAMFYWYFTPAAADPSAPLVLWLQGGPGASSMLGNFFEHGPVTLDSTGRMSRRPDNQTWASRWPLLYADSPLGTGWSFASREDGYAHNQSEVAACLAEFLERFREVHPEAPTRIVLTGESYGGHYIPALGSFLLDGSASFHVEAVAIGDGLTDPAVQILTKPRSAFAFGLLDERQLMDAEAIAVDAHNLAVAGDFVAAARKRARMEQFVENASSINLYDVRTTEQYDWQTRRMSLFFSDNTTKDLLHIPRHLNFGTPDAVGNHLESDIMRSQRHHVERLLNSGTPVLLYQGQFDWKDGVVSNEAWIRSARWPGIDGYLRATRLKWQRKCDGQVAGYWRRFRNLEQVVVLGAGHLVPMDQPLSALDMMEEFLDRHTHSDGPPSTLIV